MISGRLAWGARTYVMAVINVTPDSFSGDGILDSQQCVEHALQAIDQGAHIIDIGGESTRPGFSAVEPAVEADRVLPVIRALRQRTSSLISVDTRSGAVFRDAYQAGADIFNSVAGFDVELAKAAAELQAPYVIMHQQSHTNYPANVVDCVVEYLRDSAEQAMKLGCRKEDIIIDPGIGFGKTAEQNLELLRNLFELKRLGFPVLIGTSRKSTLGKVTGRPVDKRQFATAATVAIGIAFGADIVRIHDVREMTDVVKMSDAIVRGWVEPN